MTINRSTTLGRQAIECGNREVHSILSNYSEAGLCKLHPQVWGIVISTLAQQLPRKLSCSALLDGLQGCPTITLRAADAATGHRDARSTIAEYAALARMASKAIEDHITASSRKGQRRAASAGTALLPRQ